MPHDAEVHVVHRNLRWEVRVNETARPLVDWLSTKERAITHALARAREVGASIVVVEGPDWSTIEEVILVDGPARFGRVAWVKESSPASLRELG